MKKIVFIIVLLLFVACNEKNNGKVSQVPDKKEEALFVAKKDIKLPDYKDIKGKDLYSNLLIVYSETDRGAYLVAKGILSDLLKTRSIEGRMLKDTEVKKGDLVTSNLIIIGNITNNKIMNSMEAVLPATADGEKVTIKSADKEAGVYTGKEYGVTYFYPNLYNFNNTMILIFGNSEEALKSYDFKKSDMIVHIGKEISPVSYIEKAFVNFGKDWIVEKVEEVDPKLLDSGENDKLIVGDIKKYNFPEWAKGKTIYQIFVRSFYDSDGNGKGDLKGITQKLDYIKSLGIDIIWLTPIFDSSSTHGYDVKDYFAINKEYGTMEEYRNMVKEIHLRGMKILLDVPFNHASKQEIHFKDAYGNESSKYRKWFYFHNLKNTMYNDWYFREDATKRAVVDGDMPAWNTNNPEVVDFHASVLKFWLDPNNDGDRMDGADGYRFDVAKGPSHEYWKLLRQKVKATDPNTLMLGELWIQIEDIVKYYDNQMDAAFDFDLLGPLTTGVLREVEVVMSKQDKLVPEDNQMARFLSNHDMDRFPTYQKVPYIKLCLGMIYTLKGMPTIYYGDEIGAKGDAAENGDAGRRRPMEWYKDKKGPGMTKWTPLGSKKADGISVEEQDGKDGSLFEYYKKLIKMRKDNLDIFADGKRVDLKVYEEKDGKSQQNKKVKAYIMDKNGKKILTVLNFGKEGKYKIDFSELKIKALFKSIFGATAEIKANEDMKEIDIDAYGVLIYRNEK